MQVSFEFAPWSYDMSRFATTLTLAISMIFCFLAVAEDRAGARLQEKEETIQTLHTRLLAEEEQTKVMASKILALETFAAASKQWQQSMAQQGKALQEAVQDARKKGFEKAGPNPAAKTAVLEAHNSLGTTMNHSPKTDKDTGKR